MNVGEKKEWGDISKVLRVEEMREKNPISIIINFIIIIMRIQYLFSMAHERNVNGNRP